MEIQITMTSLTNLAFFRKFREARYGFSGFGNNFVQTNDGLQLIMF
jgi:hypothetical protein